MIEKQNCNKSEKFQLNICRQRLFDKGIKLVFNEDFKKHINNNDNRDVLYYIQNDEFVVKDSKEGFVKIEGIAMWGWVTTDIFNIV